MKILVTEMPNSKSRCPFSEQYSSNIWTQDMESRYKILCYHCSVIKGTCDLDNNMCSGLKVLEGLDERKTD